MREIIQTYKYVGLIRRRTAWEKRYLVTEIERLNNFIVDLVLRKKREKNLNMIEDAWTKEKSSSILDK